VKTKEIGKPEACRHKYTAKPCGPESSSLRVRVRLKGFFMPPMTSVRIVYRAAYKLIENGGTRQGAALAYYAVFSIAPLMLIAMYTSGAVFGQDAAQGKVHNQLDALMGAEVAKSVETFVKTADVESTVWTPAVSLAFLLVAALGAFLHARSALCAIWHLEPPHGNTWLGLLWDYALSLIMVFITATLLLISLMCSLIAPILQKSVENSVIETATYWHWIEMAASFVFLTFVFAASYRVLSGGRISWAYVWYGSFIAAVLFTIGKTLLSYYLVYTGTASMYGAAGSVIVFLIWVYYSAQILFFGAELIQARRTRQEWLNV
jgi:membrane protein